MEFKLVKVWLLLSLFVNPLLAVGEPDCTSNNCVKCVSGSGCEICMNGMKEPNVFSGNCLSSIPDRCAVYSSVGTGQCLFCKPTHYKSGG